MHPDTPTHCTVPLPGLHSDKPCELLYVYIILYTYRDYVNRNIYYHVRVHIGKNKNKHKVKAYWQIKYWQFDKTIFLCTIIL